MNTFQLQHRKRSRQHARWLLPMAALLSLAMLVLACALSAPGTLPLY